MSDFKDGYFELEGEKYSIKDEQAVQEFFNHLTYLHSKQLEDLKKQQEKQLKKKDENLAAFKINESFLAEKLEAYKDLIPEGMKDTKARQRVAVIRGIYQALARALQGVNITEMAIEDISAVTELIGLVKTVHSDFIQLAHKIDKFEGGKC